MFQHTAARRRLVKQTAKADKAIQVSTHSRPKAAGLGDRSSPWVRFGFNTQPPEGGWVLPFESWPKVIVSTHSRPKAAGLVISLSGVPWLVSTHSRPKAAGIPNTSSWVIHLSFNTQPPEGGWPMLLNGGTTAPLFQHTAARRRLGSNRRRNRILNQFQHTAARRRLGPVDASRT